MSYQSLLAELDLPRLRLALGKVTEALLAERHEHGYWEGELSSSALSTATAVSALSVVWMHQHTSASKSSLDDLIRQGVSSLRTSQNADGGFGDTDRSHSNIATSCLVLAASELARQTVGTAIPTESLDRLRTFIDHAGGIEGLRQRYGRDKTFVVPILCNLAVAGLVPWKDVPPLPFELAAFPQSMYRWLKMPVVSYAVPALVAIGQARHRKHPSWFFPLRWIRAALVRRTLNVLARMQPPSGGYLEATPLTSFVVMSLAASGLADHPVCHRGVDFLRASMRSDGSWPIDTNLATWVTSLSMLALSGQPQTAPSWASKPLVDWLLSCQHQVRHPFTGADPGGWGWTNLSGAVPDGDDTPAAILALRGVASLSGQAGADSPQRAIEQGIDWLLRLQNRDGGMPTFCRGWGKLPFDRSSTDLTAHALRVWDQDSARPQVATAISRARNFLLRSQLPDGSWLPLWFGNQDRPQEDNPVYGTAKVLMAPDPAAPAAEAQQSAKAIAEESWFDAMRRGVGYLVNSQNPDGGWGGGPSVEQVPRGQAPRGQAPRDQVPRGQERTDSDPGPAQDAAHSTIEETALAIEALVFRRQQAVNSDQQGFNPQTKAIDQAIIAGVRFLVSAIEREGFRTPWPIGFYFAKLWYHERLYPLIYSVSALGRLVSMADSTAAPMTAETSLTRTP